MNTTARPNILFLMSDEHRADVTGYEGNSVVRTPVLDELARTGVVFRNAYTASPICIPGRQCLMSGQLPKTCGCEGWIDLKPGYRTFARVFSQYAYNTVASGKLHHMGQDQMQGWTSRLAPDAMVTPDNIEGAVESEFDRYQPEPGTGKWGNQKDIERAGIANGPYQAYDAIVQQSSLHFVRRYFLDSYYDRPQCHRPLLLKHSFHEPHYPYFTDEAKFNYYLKRVPIFQEKPCDHPVLSLSQQLREVNATERDIRRATAAYYGMVETVDSHYGELMDELANVGQDLDDWIIVYTTDHGEMLGQHGLWEKTRFYEASVRVPLIVRWPRGFDGGRVVEENVSLCDLFATLCELAGLPVPEGLDSRSLVPLLKGEVCEWRNEAVSQMNTDHVMIKQDHLKYQYYGGDVPEVLFDLEEDPGEAVNVAASLAYSDAMGRFRERLAQLGHGPAADPHYRNAGYQSGC